MIINLNIIFMNIDLNKYTKEIKTLYPHLTNKECEELVTEIYWVLKRRFDLEIGND